MAPYNHSFVPCQKLKEISIVLKRGQTPQSRIMNFIFTMFGCIALEIDHRSRLHEFKDVFSERSLNILRNDLENLLCFKTKLFHSLILELLLETLKKETNYRNRCIKLCAVDNTHIRQWDKVILQRRVKAIVKYLIFRKVKTSCCLYDEISVPDWYSYKYNISDILNNQVNPRRTYIIYNNFCDTNGFKRINYERNIAHCICYKIKDVRAKNIKEFETFAKNESQISESSVRVGNGHFFIRVYCTVLCCALLWICLCYSCTLNFLSNFT